MTAATEGRPAVLVTGGGTGIGLASAEALAAYGWDVAISGRRAQVLEESAAAIRAASPDARAEAIVADVGDGEQAEAAVAEAISRSGRLDAVVCSAGAYEEVEFDQMTPEAWDRITNVLIRGTAIVAMTAARHMVANGGGRIVFIGSVSAQISERGSSHYVAGKAAMHSLARSITVDLGARGVIANVVASGFVETPMTKGLWAHENQEMAQGIIGGLNPLRRGGRPEELGNVVRYLVAEAPDYLAGATITVDGGQTVYATIH